MIIIISSAKTLASQPSYPTLPFTVPVLLEYANRLADRLKKYSSAELGKLLAINTQLSKLNAVRFAKWTKNHTLENAHPAIFLYKGDVYKGINIDTYTHDELLQAQQRLRIISGLYGLLRPLDIIQPYRLEMSTIITIDEFNNLYEFWVNKLTEELNQTLVELNFTHLINLASNEYSQAIDFSKLKATVITPMFYEMRKGELKTVSIYLKKARGLMASFIIKNNLKTPDEIKLFNEDGYSYIEQYSNEHRWVFAR